MALLKLLVIAIIVFTVNADRPCNEKARTDSAPPDYSCFTRDDYQTTTTTNWGAEISDDDNSLKAGARGPTLLEDFHFREKMQHFDHERIPERVVHARGSAAYGQFQVYRNLSDLTAAKFLQDPSLVTPVFLRFSAVLANLGTSDTTRDVRGFAVRFYTNEGNYDIVGNNMPVFFIQDAVKFPDLIHAGKPEPHNQMPTGGTAHDNAWDFLSLTPESAHMIMWVLSGRGMVRSLRMVEGFGVHTFLWVNSAGVARYVKYHFKPLQGLTTLLWDESQTISGKNADFHRQDLWEAIERGDYPQWEVGVQIVELADASNLDFDLIDVTKLIPETQVPIIPIGLLTLNRNPDNFFAETEQVTFHPGHVVPGIDFTNDPLLQGRLFSYLDTQIGRHRSTNYLNLAVNRPIKPVHNNQRDGVMQTEIIRGRTNYYPNSLGGNYPRPDPVSGFVSYPFPVSGTKTRARSPTFNDYYSQAQLFWNSITAFEKQQLIDSARFELGKVKDYNVRARMIDMFNHIDNYLARSVAVVIGVEPPAAKYPNMNKTTTGLSIDMYPKNTIATRRVAVLISDGVDDDQFTIVTQFLMNKRAYIDVVAPRLGTIMTRAGAQINVSLTFTTTSMVLHDALFIPGGAASVNSLLNDPYMEQYPVEFAQLAFKHAKPIAASGEGLQLLAAAGVPFVNGTVVNDSNGVVTLGFAQRSSLNDFASQFAEDIRLTRFWSRLKLQ